MKILVIFFIAFIHYSYMSMIHTHSISKVSDTHKHTTHSFDVYVYTSNNDISLFNTHIKKDYFTKKDSDPLLLNNKSLYVGKSPARNKNDSLIRLNTIIIYYSAIIHKLETPKIRSPTYSI